MKLSTLKNSSFLTKDDVGRAGVNLVIKNVIMDSVGMPGQEETKPTIIWVDDRYKPMVLNQTNLAILSTMYPADDTDEWIGKAVNVYEDPLVQFAGKIVGGLRLREPVTVQLNQDLNDPIPAALRGQDVPQ